MYSFLRSIGITARIEDMQTRRGVWTLRLVTNTPFCSFGKGFSYEEALDSATGEMCERILLGNFYEDYALDDIYPEAKALLDPSIQRWYDISNLQQSDLIDFSSSSFDILSQPFDYKNTTIYLPINLIQNLYASNGMAAHTDKKLAFEGALLEVVERYVKFYVIKNALALPPISHPLNDELIQLYDASLDGRYPVIAALYKEDENVLLSFGAHLKREVAIKKAYSELVQGLQGHFGQILLDKEAVADWENLERHFIDLSGDIHQNFFGEPDYKARPWRFENLDFFDDMLIRYRKGGPLHAYHIIVPGISEIYPFDDLLYANKNEGKFYRHKVLHYEPSFDEDLAEVAHKELGSFIGIPFQEPLYAKDLPHIPPIDPTYKTIQKSLKLLNGF